MRRLLLALLGVLLAACASSPEPIFYALDARSGAAVSDRALRIEIRHPALPKYLDRPAIVRRKGPDRLELDGSQRWGAPLEQMVADTLAEDVAARLPKSTVYTEAGSISARPDVRVECQFQRFELGSDGTIDLVALVAVHFSDAADRARLSRQVLRVRPRSSNAADVVSGMSGLLASLADAVARAIAAGPAPAPAPPNPPPAPAPSANPAPA